MRVNKTPLKGSLINKIDKGIKNKIKRKESN